LHSLPSSLPTLQVPSAWFSISQAEKGAQTLPAKRDTTSQPTAEPPETEARGPGTFMLAWVELCNADSRYGSLEEALVLSAKSLRRTGLVPSACIDRDLTHAAAW
jgi:hypothetical protein